MFLTFHHCSIEAEVIGKRVNQGGGYVGNKESCQNQDFFSALSAV